MGNKVLNEKDITLDFIKQLYSNISNDNMEYLKGESDFNLSSWYYYTREPSNATYYDPADNGDGYFIGYEDYKDAMLEYVIYELYLLIENDYDIEAKEFEEYVLKKLYSFDDENIITNTFPIIYENCEFQDACWEKYSTNLNIVD